MRCRGVIGKIKVVGLIGKSEIPKPSDKGCLIQATKLSSLMTLLST